MEDLENVLMELASLEKNPQTTAISGCLEEYLAHVAKTGNALFVQNEIESVELSEVSEENSESVEGAIADKEAEKVSITKLIDEFRC